MSHSLHTLDYYSSIHATPSLFNIIKFMTTPYPCVTSFPEWEQIMAFMAGSNAIFL